MGRVSSRHAASAVAIVVVGGLLVTAVNRIDLVRVTSEIARAHLEWIAGALVCYATILPLWATQWLLLAPAAPGRKLRSMLRVVSMTSSVLNTTPFLVGEAAGVFFLASRAGVDRASGLAVLAMDQLLVGLAKIVVLSAAATALPLPPVMRVGMRALALGVAILLITLVGIARVGNTAQLQLAERLPRRVGAIVMRSVGALAPLRSPVRGGGAFVLALLKKGCELLAILAIQHAFGVTLPATSALLVLGALNLATLLPLVPGNAGVFEASVVLAYTWLGVPAERALGIALVQHACYFVALALPGYGWLGRSAALRSAAAAR